MQRIILSSKNTIMVLGGALILMAFAGEWLGAGEGLSHGTLLAASILGVLPIAIQAWQALRVKVVSIDVLVTIAVLGALAIWELEESAIVTFLFLFGAFLEQRTLNKTRSAIRELTEMAPETAWKLMDNGIFLEVSVEEVDRGDTLLVKTGARIPVDGRILRGEGHVNEASITGEALPMGKKEGESVFAGTILEDGTLEIAADRVGEDTTFGKIIQLVEEAQDSKSEAERFIDRFSRYYTPAVLLLGGLAYILTRNPELAITILVLGCPGALVIGVPVSHVAGIGNGARNGILLKGSEVIRDFSRVDTMAFDKTGTLTMGNPQVADLVIYGEEGDWALSCLASVEGESDHPLAKAIVKKLKEYQRYPVQETRVVKGAGILARIQGHAVAVGNEALMAQEGVFLSPKAREDLLRYEEQGDSMVLTAIDGELQAILGIRDQIRPGVKEDLQRLRSLGVRNLVLLSGDSQGTVDRVAGELGLTQAFGHMLPEDKSAYIESLQKQGQIVAFVGDGVNDSPSLARAEIGIAMGHGTDVAIETSNVVLMNSDFSRLPHALGLVKATARNMKENILIAIGVVAFLLANLFLSQWMNMSVGMLVHEGSILVVILNGMRLLRFRLKKEHR